MFKLYDTFHGTPVLVGTFASLQDAKKAARSLNENTRGRFRPIIEHNNQILKNWTY